MSVRARRWLSSTTRCHPWLQARFQPCDIPGCRHASSPVTSPTVGASSPVTAPVQPRHLWQVGLQQQPPPAHVVWPAGEWIYSPRAQRRCHLHALKLFCIAGGREGSTGLCFPTCRCPKSRPFTCLVSRVMDQPGSSCFGSSHQLLLGRAGNEMPCSAIGRQRPARKRQLSPA